MRRGGVQWAALTVTGRRRVLPTAGWGPHRRQQALSYLEWDSAPKNHLQGRVIPAEWLGGEWTSEARGWGSHTYMTQLEEHHRRPPRNLQETTWERVSMRCAMPRALIPENTCSYQKLRWSFCPLSTSPNLEVPEEYLSKIRKRREVPRLLLPYVGFLSPNRFWVLKWMWDYSVGSRPKYLIVDWTIPVLWDLILPYSGLSSIWKQDPSLINGMTGKAMGPFWEFIQAQGKQFERSCSKR